MSKAGVVTAVVAGALLLTGIGLAVARKPSTQEATNVRLSVGVAVTRAFAVSGGQPADFSGALVADNGTPIASQTIVLTVGNSLVATVTTASDGTFSGSFITPTTVGSYILDATFAGATVGGIVYGSSQGSAPFTVASGVSGGPVMVAGVGPTSLDLYGTPVSYSASASGGSGTYASYQWTVTDPSSNPVPFTASAGGTSITFTPEAAGQFSVTCLVTDSLGETGVWASPLLVGPITSPPYISIDTPNPQVLGPLGGSDQVIGGTNLPGGTPMDIYVDGSLATSVPASAPSGGGVYAPFSTYVGYVTLPANPSGTLVYHSIYVKGGGLQSPTVQVAVGNATVNIGLLDSLGTGPYSSVTAGSLASPPPELVGTTNLPDGTLLMVAVNGATYGWVAVSGGKFSTPIAYVPAFDSSTAYHIVVVVPATTVTSNTAIVNWRT